MAQSKRWCFTINNFSNAEFEALFDETRVEGHGVSYVVAGKETGDTGTPHIQGYVEFSLRKRLRSVKRFVGNRAHCEVSRGSPEEASLYCKKDDDYRESGQLEQRGQGRRSDIDRFVEWIQSFDGRPTDRDMANAFPSLFLRYSVRLRELRDHLLPEPQFLDGDLNDWQEELYGILNGESDDRKILFYVDEQGGNGKSWFCRYMMLHRPEDVQVLSVGKRDDLAHAIDPQKKIFLFNIPRNGMQYLQYQLLEQLKDRMVFSPKYDSRTKILHYCPFVVVFSNEYPDMTAMTDDRYVIEEFN